MGSVDESLYPRATVGVKRSSVVLCNRSFSLCVKSRKCWLEDRRRVAYVVMKRSYLLCCLLLALPTHTAFGAEFVARVLAVHEGDRLTIHHQGRKDTIALRDVDCPELKQPYGKQAKHVTAAYVANREVVVRNMRQDRQGRTTADILLEDGRNIAQELVKEGLAWVQSGPGHDQALKDLEELARASKTGLWSEPNPAPPWKWKSTKPVRHH